MKGYSWLSGRAKKKKKKPLRKPNWQKRCFFGTAQPACRSTRALHFRILHLKTVENNNLNVGEFKHKQNFFIAVYCFPISGVRKSTFRSMLIFAFTITLCTQASGGAGRPTELMKRIFLLNWAVFSNSHSFLFFVFLIHLDLRTEFSGSLSSKAKSLRVWQTF